MSLLLMTAQSQSYFTGGLTTISGTRLDHGDLAVCSGTDLLFKTGVFATVWVRNPTMASCRGSRSSLDIPECP